MKPGDVALGMFPFGDAPGMKLRPVLVLSEPVGPVQELLVAYISSIVPSPLLPTDIVLDPQSEMDRTTCLKVASALRLHKLATIHRSSLVRVLGGLSPQRMLDTKSRLRAWLGL